MTELIITEKPSSAQKVAEALADGKPVRKKNKQAVYYELAHKKKPIISRFGSRTPVRPR